MRGLSRGRPPGSGVTTQSREMSIAGRSPRILGEQGIRRESTYQVKQKHSPSSLEWDLDSNMISRKTEKVEAQSNAISKLLRKER